MTDKKIINGVDVSECPDIYCGTNCSNTAASCPNVECGNNPLCCYKQLKRKEEIMVQKSQLCTAYLNELINLREQLEHKEQECQRLENENKRLVGEIANNIFDEQEEFVNHKLTLEKIKNIAELSEYPPCEKYCYGCNDCEHCTDEITDKGETCMRYGLNRILNIVNEVENAK